MTTSMWAKDRVGLSETTDGWTKALIGFGLFIGFADKGVFTPALFSLVKSDWFITPLVQFVWTGMNTVIALACRPKQPH